ncbi:MAG TPA: DUF3459 domain-containing protein, partial [Candidatus Thermoplasmatota archaeon]|nr:DUF3459 domain-containing protein [Candidatus Thermoplasmatota archaeon]
FTPLLFMGEEWAERAPFPYFTSHSDERLAQAVREGRRREFADFRWSGEPPDPQAPETFRSAILDRARHGAAGERMRAYYRELLRIRREHPVWRNRSLASQDVAWSERPRWVRVTRRGASTLGGPGREAVLVLHFDSQDADVPLPHAGPWQCVLDSRQHLHGDGRLRKPEAGGAATPVGGSLTVQGPCAVLLEAGLEGPAPQAAGRPARRAGKRRSH